MVAEYSPMVRDRIYYIDTNPSNQKIPMFHIITTCSWSNGKLQLDDAISVIAEVTFISAEDREEICHSLFFVIPNLKFIKSNASCIILNWEPKYRIVMRDTNNNCNNSESVNIISKPFYSTKLRDVFNDISRVSYSIGNFLKGCLEDINIKVNRISDSIERSMKRYILSERNNNGTCYVFDTIIPATSFINAIFLTVRVGTPISKFIIKSNVKEVVPFEPILTLIGLFMVYGGIQIIGDYCGNKKRRRPHLNTIFYTSALIIANYLVVRY